MKVQIKSPMGAIANFDLNQSRTHALLGDGWVFIDRLLMFGFTVSNPF